MSSFLKRKVREKKEEALERLVVPMPHVLHGHSINRSLDALMDEGYNLIIEHIEKFYGQIFQEKFTVKCTNCDFSFFTHLRYTPHYNYASWSFWMSFNDNSIEYSSWTNKRSFLNVPESCERVFEVIMEEALI